VPTDGANAHQQIFKYSNTNRGLIKRYRIRHLANQIHDFEYLNIREGSYGSAHDDCKEEELCYVTAIRLYPRPIHSPTIADCRGLLFDSVNRFLDGCEGLWIEAWELAGTTQEGTTGQ
jgi:hypothetical protein